MNRYTRLGIFIQLAIAAPAFAQLPNPRLTPGVARPMTQTTLCTTKWGADVRHVTVAMKKQVFAAYGVPWSTHADYEVDHLISRELGGADDVKNLWPQPWTGAWNAHMKDRVENRLHKEVCAGTITLDAAQRQIAHDWTLVYRTYFGASQ